jgi:hypothetical protein
VKGAARVGSSDSNLAGVRLNAKFQEYLPGLELAEDVMNIYKTFDLSMQTLLLAVSIVHRIISSSRPVTQSVQPSLGEEGIFRCLKNFSVPVKDQKKLVIHFAYSLALKYNERVVPRFEDIA